MKVFKIAKKNVVRTGLVYSVYSTSYIYILFLNGLLTTKSHGGYGRHDKETKIK